jgi:hypothetical protein
LTFTGGPFEHASALKNRPGKWKGHLREAPGRHRREGAEDLAEEVDRAGEEDLSAEAGVAYSTPPARSFFSSAANGGK